MIPKPEKIGEDYILEPYAGVEFRPELYDSLSPEKKKKAAYDFADFLNFIHQKEPKDEVAQLDITHGKIKGQDIDTLDEIFVE